jgi:hypothetical protein
MRGRLRASVGIVAAACCMAGLTAATALATTTQLTIPFGGVIVNDCTGEMIAYNGELRQEFRAETDATGRSHFELRSLSSDMSAVGLTSGLRYRFIVVQHMGDYAGSSPFAGVIFTNSLTYKLVSQGPGANMEIGFNVHFTLTKAGDLAAEVDHDHTSCHG